MVNTSKLILFLLFPFLASGLCAQSGGQNIPDDTQEEVIARDDTDPNGRKFSITVNPNDDSAPDTKVVVKELDEDGDVVNEWVLDGAGDGTGSQPLPQGHSVEVEDVDWGTDNPDAAHVDFD